MNDRCATLVLTILLGVAGSVLGQSPSASRSAELRPRLVAQTSHGGEVHCVAFSPDGERVLTGSGDRTARLWNAETGEVVQSFVGHGKAVRSVASSPDGERVLTGSGDKTARLWNAETGEEVQRFVGHTGAVWSVGFSPDGERVLTGSLDETARLWNAETGEEVQRFEGHRWDNREPTPSNFASRSGYKKEGSVRSVASSPDGERVLTGSGDKTARLWNVETGEEVQRFVGHGEGVSSVAFSPDGERVLTGCLDGTARLWNAETGEEVQRFPGGALGGAEWSVAFSPGGPERPFRPRQRASRLRRCQAISWGPPPGRALSRRRGASRGRRQALLGRSEPAQARARGLGRRDRGAGGAHRR